MICWRRVMVIAVRQYYLMAGSYARILPMFVWSSLDIAVWGFTTRYLTSVTDVSLHVGTTLLGCVVLWNFLTRVMHALTTTFLEDIWARNLLNLFASPLRVIEYILGLTLTTLCIATVGLFSMCLVSMWLFDLSIGAWGGHVGLALAVLCLTGLAMGIVGCAMVLRFGPAAEWLVWPLPVVMTPFAGVFYPQAILPRWMQVVAHGVPPAYVFEALRLPESAAGDRLAPLVWGLVLAFGYVGAAYAIFGRTFKTAVQTGLLARYSAESIN